MDVSPASLDNQRSIERRFNCVVCLCARFRMVYGRCQHRICSACAYTSTTGVLRRQFHRCPSCQQEDAFPTKKPTIPEDNIEQQKMLGVMACQNEGCTQEFWSWEKPEHDLTCSYKNSPQRKKYCLDARKTRSTTTPKTTTTRKTRSEIKKGYTLRSRYNCSDPFRERRRVSCRLQTSTL